MKKILLSAAFASILVVCFGLLFSACATNPMSEPKPITERMPTMYFPEYNYVPAMDREPPVGIAVGVLQPRFRYESIPPNSWELSDLEEQYRREFIEAFSQGIERILLYKGLAVRGPFTEIEEMNRHEKSTCDYVILPEILVIFQPSRSQIIERLPDYVGPQGEALIYGKSDANLSARAELKYLIFDPMTGQKLGKHAVRTGAVSKYYEQLWSHWTVTDSAMTTQREWRILQDDRYAEYYNAEFATGHVLDGIYNVLMSKMYDLISAEEFKFLQEYKEEFRKTSL